MEVVLSLDSENLACHCWKLEYKCPTPARGSHTVLKSNFETREPLNAIKDGHTIKAKELTLVAANLKGEGQQVVAVGPGQVDLFDRAPGKGYTTHALWKGMLTSTKWKEGERDLDLLELTEDADFIDDEHGQKLFGQRLQVWLEPSDAPALATPADSARQTTVGGARQKPVKVAAFDRVRAESPDLKITECSTLKMRFKDEAKPGTTLPAALPGVPAAPPTPPGQMSPLEALTPPLPTLPGTGAGHTVQSPPPPGKALTPAPRHEVSPPPPSRLDGPVADKSNADKPPEKPKRPIDLRAHDVLVDVLRTGEKNDLQELVAIGNVHVHQDPEKPGDKGVEIEGDTLNLLHFAEGDVLKVHGDGRENANLQLGELVLIGPKVLIDQRANSAFIEGVGLMHMPSNTTFEGGKPSKPGTRMTVHWTRDMVFNKRDADFNGGVIAYQDGSELRCNTLQVALDRDVSFKEGQKDGQGAKVERVVAHGKVTVLDIIKEEKTDKVISQRRLECHQLDVNNPENIVNATGPGKLFTLQYGTPQSAGPANPPKAQAPPANAKADELMLTRVEFRDRMFSSANADNTVRTSKFMGKVEVFYLPADSLDAKVDRASLPKGGMYLQCDTLKVLQEQTADKRTAQILEAERQVWCSSDDIRAQADMLRFDQASDVVFLYRTPGNPAAAYQRVGGPGGNVKVVRAQRIRYDRKTGEVSAEEVDSINGLLEPPARLHAFDVAMLGRAAGFIPAVLERRRG